MPVREVVRYSRKTEMRKSNLLPAKHAGVKVSYFRKLSENHTFRPIITAENSQNEAINTSDCTFSIVAAIVIIYRMYIAEIRHQTAQLQAYTTRSAIAGKITDGQIKADKFLLVHAPNRSLAIRISTITQPKLN